MRTAALLFVVSLTGCTVMTSPIVRDVRAAPDGHVVAERCELHLIVLGPFSNGHVSDCKNVDASSTPAAAPATSAH